MENKKVKNILCYVIGFLCLGILCAGCSQSKTENIDDYISKHKFEEALHLASKMNHPNSASLKVVRAEFSYWLSVKDLERALLTINEMKRITTDPLNIDLPEVTLNIAVYESSLNLTRAYCEQGQKEKAEQFVKTLINSFKYYLRDEKILNKSQYDEIKSTLSADEIIEPYHTILDKSYVDGVNEEYHKVHRLYSPKTDALSILKSCK